MISLNYDLKKWLKYGWINEIFLLNLKNENIILEEEYYDILTAVPDDTKEDLLQKVVVTTSKII